jgi:caa3-type cytochrome oxidase assembly factor Caa3/CtaG
VRSRWLVSVVAVAAGAAVVAAVGPILGTSQAASAGHPGSGARGRAWSHVVGLSWLAARLPTSRRIAYLCVGMLSEWILSPALAFQPAPVYPPYVHAIGSVCGMRPLDDQRLAAGLMWAIGMLPFNIALAAGVRRLLDAEEAATAVEIAPSAPSAP